MAISGVNPECQHRADERAGRSVSDRRSFSCRAPPQPSGWRENRALTAQEQRRIRAPNPNRGIAADVARRESSSGT